jgi:hypothetical protein
MQIMAINIKRVIGNIAKNAMRAGINGGVTPMAKVGGSVGALSKVAKKISMPDAPKPSNNQYLTEMKTVKAKDKMRMDADAVKREKMMAEAMKGAVTKNKKTGVVTSTAKF